LPTNRWAVSARIFTCFVYSHSTHASLTRKQRQLQRKLGSYHSDVSIRSFTPKSNPLVRNETSLVAQPFRFDAVFMVIQSDPSPLIAHQNNKSTMHRSNSHTTQPPKLFKHDVHGDLSNSHSRQQRGLPALA
jgi:hypothetical protein